MDSSINVANQLRFITLQKNTAAKNAAAIGNYAAQNTFSTQTQIAPAIKQDTVEISKNQDKWAADDGKISAKEKLINFGKGVISPVTTMFSSPKNFMLGAAGIIGSGLLIAATGGAFAPVMVAAGVTGGTIGLLRSGYRAMTAKTDDEAKKAWQGLGLGSTVTIGSIAGSKAALKGAGIDTKGMSTLSATVKCFKSVPAQVRTSAAAFSSGKALANIKNAFHIKNKKDEIKPETKNEAPAGDKKNAVEETRVNDKGSIKPDDVDTPVIEESAAAGENAISTKEDGKAAAIENSDPPKDTVKNVSKPKKTSKPRRKRKSRIKHKVDQKQAQQVKKEVKDITAILDDFALDNNIDTQFRNKIEDVRRIASSPMEQPKQDVTDLINTIRHLESCKNNPSSIAADGKTVDFPFDEAISYIEKLLAKYDMERIVATPGEAFNGRIMQAVEVKETSNPKLKDTIFEILLSGFKKQGKQGTGSDWKLRVGKYAAPGE